MQLNKKKMNNYKGRKTLHKKVGESKRMLELERKKCRLKRTEEGEPKDRKIIS